MKKMHILFFIFLIISQLSAQALQHSIEEILNKDGRIEKGISGSFNGRGYKLSYAENGEPILRKNSPNETQSFSWTSISQIPGANDQVKAVAIDSNGNIYIGGVFGWPHRGFAKWDGVTWSSMGYINGSVYAIAVDGTDIYVGGSFNDIDGNSLIKNIAKWNGSSWSAMGTEFNGVYVNTVYAIAISGTDIFVGGDFTITINSNNTPNIAKWNGTAWSQVGGGVDQTGVRTLAVDGNGDVYVGGTFTSAGGSSANYIAKWNGTNWSALGTGLNKDVYTIAVNASGNIYAGGVFTQAGGNTAKLMAVWNGTSWSELGGGVTSSYSAVNTIAIDGTDIYVGGSFTNIGGSGFSNIAKWNGSAWSELASGISSSYVNSIVSYNNVICVGGSFSTAGDILSSTGVVALNVVKWDGNNWIQMGEGPTNKGGLTGEIFSIAVDGSDVYFGGNFTQAGGVDANGIAQWDGTNWIALGSGVNGYVYSIVVTGPYIYAGGTFTTAGGNTASRIAKWAKPSELEPTGGWHALVDGIYEGVNGEVRDMVLHSDGNLYVGGFFTAAAGNNAEYLAKWSGSAWSSVNNNYGPDNAVLSLASNGSGDLFIGGEFLQAGGVTVNYIAKWDGTNWSGLGNGFDGAVYSLETSGSDLYAGGQFNFSGSTYLKKIAKWNGTTWTKLGAGVGGTPYAILAFGGNIYVGGNISEVYNTDVDIVTVNSIARWDGSSWSAIGDGTIGDVNAITVSTSEGVTYVGGDFVNLGDFTTGAGYYAKFTDSQTPFPVQLTFFKIKQSNSGVILNWQTATEVNNYGFDIQRASTPLSPHTEWETIGFVEGHGNSNSPKEYSFIDSDISVAERSRSYRLKQLDFDGAFEYSDIATVELNGTMNYKLSQNHPNPFNPSTQIAFTIPKTGMVKLNVYNILGELVTKLVNENLDAGSYQYQFNASNLSSGIYFYSISVNEFTEVKKMNLVK